jgi:hypothetical protein
MCKIIRRGIKYNGCNVMYNFGGPLVSSFENVVDKCVYATGEKMLFQGFVCAKSFVLILGLASNVLDSVWIFKG